MSESPASELRHDRLGGRTVIVAAGRAARPHQYAAAPDATRAGDCPFCPGNEQATPPETARTGSGPHGSPDWRVRVFPNLFPIVGGEHAGPGATGAHEVVAISPGHAESFGQLDDPQAAEVLLVLRDRVRAHLEAGHAYAVAIVNHRRAAGASIAHPHAQVLALDFVPPAVEAGVGRFTAAGEDLVHLDAHAGSPVLDDAATPPGTLAWSPYAASSPALVRVAHTGAGSDFAAASDDEVIAVAAATRGVLARLHAWLADPPYNLVVHTAPPGTAAGDFHWYVEITPRVSVLAGFEQATGVLVNTMPPEQAAEALRNQRTGANEP
jgi:UDPglucose--hexose-1-phosphate uridylyltransferase